jgi:hypothetical protein
MTSIRRHVDCIAIAWLGADHLTFEGGGGLGDFEKNFLQGYSEQK